MVILSALSLLRRRVYPEWPRERARRSHSNLITPIKVLTPALRGQMNRRWIPDRYRVRES